MASQKIITKLFNAALLLFYLFSCSVGYLFDPAGGKSVPWDKVYNWSPPIAASGAILIVLFLSLVGAIITRIFWNRFVADVFKVRGITYDESLAIVLIVAIISS